MHGPAVLVRAVAREAGGSDAAREISVHRHGPAVKHVASLLQRDIGDAAQVAGECEQPEALVARNAAALAVKNKAAAPMHTRAEVHGQAGREHQRIADSGNGGIGVQIGLTRNDKGRGPGHVERKQQREEQRERGGQRADQMTQGATEGNVHAKSLSCGERGT